LDLGHHKSTSKNIDNPRKQQDDNIVIEAKRKEVKDLDFLTDKIQRIIDKKCDKQLKKRLFTKLLRLENNPQSYAKPLRAPLASIWEIYFFIS
jgi:hypothetical protein